MVRNVPSRNGHDVVHHDFIEEYKSKEMENVKGEIDRLTEEAGLHNIVCVHSGCREGPAGGGEGGRAGSNVAAARGNGPPGYRRTK